MVEEGEDEDLESVKELAGKAPEWSDGVILYDNNVYPLAKSKYAKGEYYFSTSWRSLKRGVKAGNIAVLKDGSVHSYRVKRKGDKYIQVVLT